MNNQRTIPPQGQIAIHQQAIYGKRAPGQLRIGNFYKLVNTDPGSQLCLPQGASVSIRSERISVRGAWKITKFDVGTTQIGKRFQPLDSVVMDESSDTILDGLLAVSGYQPQWISSGDTVPLPPGSPTSARTRVGGNNGKDRIRCYLKSGERLPLLIDLLCPCTAQGLMQRFGFSTKRVDSFGGQ